MNLLFFRQSRIGLVRQSLQCLIHVLAGETPARSRTKEWARQTASAFRQITVHGFSGVLGKEYFASNASAFPFDVREMLASVLVQFQGQQLGNPQSGMQQYKEYGVIANRVLIFAFLQVHELLGGGFQPGDFDVSESLPFRGFCAKVVDSFTRIAGEKRSMAMNPIGAMPERGQRPVDRGWRFPLILLQMFEKPRGHGSRPMVGLVGTNGVREEVEEGIQVSAFRLNRILRPSGGFNLHIEVAPRHKALGSFG